MHYIVGDIQGCYNELRALLDKVHFDPQQDCLIAVGDLVARGPDSLAVLRLFMELGDAARTVLGNHDLHLLSILSGQRKARASDHLDAVLKAPDQEQLIAFLRQQPLALWLDEVSVLVTHAGLPPQWQRDDALAASAEVSAVLTGPDWQQLLANMYGNEPALWRPDLAGYPRLRFAINALTRMRFCHPDGRLDFSCKASPQAGQDAGLLPWYRFHPSLPYRLAFGHWAALAGQVVRPDIKALDTGCVWGNSLTLWCPESDQLHQQLRLA